MTDIVEQTARVLTNELHHTASPYDLAEALADAGLLREPTRTVPTRGQVAEALANSYYDSRTKHGGFSVGHDAAADAVLTLLAGQPTVAEVRAQALEEAANDAENLQLAVIVGMRTGPYASNAAKGVTDWLADRAQQIRDGK